MLLNSEAAVEHTTPGKLHLLRASVPIHSDDIFYYVGNSGGGWNFILSICFPGKGNSGKITPSHLDTFITCKFSESK